MRPTALLVPRLSRRALSLRWNWCSSAMALMRSRVSRLMSALSFSARDTVAFDTPARRARSAMFWIWRVVVICNRLQYAPGCTGLSNRAGRPVPTGPPAEWNRALRLQRVDFEGRLVRRGGEAALRPRPHPRPQPRRAEPAPGGGDPARDPRRPPRHQRVVANPLPALLRVVHGDDRPASVRRTGRVE